MFGTMFCTGQDSYILFDRALVCLCCVKKFPIDQVDSHDASRHHLGYPACGPIEAFCNICKYKYRFNSNHEEAPQHQKAVNLIKVI